MLSSRVVSHRDIYIALNLHDASRAQLTTATIDFRKLKTCNYRCDISHYITLVSGQPIYHTSFGSTVLKSFPMNRRITSIIINYLSTLSNSGTLYDFII